jgi:hypothetical protein
MATSISMSSQYDLLRDIDRELERMHMMGATSKETADMRSAYMQQEMHRAQMNAASNSAFGVASPFATTMASSTARTKPLNINDIPSMQMPLSALVDLWRAKHGDYWMDGSKPMPNDDEALFWSFALQRLRAANKMETVRDWSRLREDV